MIRSHDHHFFEVLEILGYAGHHKWYSKLFELHFPMKHLSYCFETSPECLFFICVMFGTCFVFFWLMFGPLWRLLGCFFGVWSRVFSPRCRGTVWRWSSHKVDLVLDLPVPVLRVQDAKFVSLSLGMAEWVVWPNLWYRKKRGELMDGWLMMNDDS